jgi:hypothetical protein
MEACIFNDEKDLDGNTPIYKYMSIEGFLYLLKYEQIMFSKLTSWPDASEGARFDFFQRIHGDDKYSKKAKSQFLGSPWSLQTENSCLYSDEKKHKNAEEELKKVGSASMWETYCKQGGVRIKTTIGKVEKALNSSDNCFDSFKGIVQYEPSSSWNKTLNSSGLISKLFVKRVSFRYESEYRFILVAENEIKKSQIFFNVGNLFDFVDEFLICPAISSNTWISRMLYHYAVGTSSPINIPGTNQKNGRQYCRISNLYGNISEEI